MGRGSGHRPTEYVAVFGLNQRVDVTTHRASHNHELLVAIIGPDCIHVEVSEFARLVAADDWDASDYPSMAVVRDGAR